MASRGKVRNWLAVVAMLSALSLTGACGTNSPEEQAERERKVASVQLFRLHMTKDLWHRTNHDAKNRSIDKPQGFDEGQNGVVTIELTGPQMVDYLRILDYNAHGGPSAVDDSLAIAVYDTLAPVVDQIRTPPAPDASVPEVTIHAAVESAAPSVTPTS